MKAVVGTPIVRCAPDGLLSPNGRSVLCPACGSPGGYAHAAFAHPDSLLACGICGLEYRRVRRELSTAELRVLADAVNESLAA